MEWRTVTEFPRYEVSEAGDVRNTRTGRVLKPGLNSCGYRSYSLGYGNTRLASRLVALAFLAAPHKDQVEVAHNDGSRTNDHFSNLRWASKIENQRDRLIHGTHNRGERGGAAKFTDLQAAELRKQLKAGASRMALARKHEVSYETIRALDVGETYVEAHS